MHISDIERSNMRLTNLEQYSKFNPDPGSISHFLEFGRFASTDHSYLLMRKEVPARLANMVKEVVLLPVKLQLNCCLTFLCAEPPGHSNI